MTAEPHNSLPEGVVQLTSSIRSETATEVQLLLAGEVRPSERTDFVFILDVSPTLQETIRSGEYARETFGILQRVLQYDDDGIDFILGSTLIPDQSTPSTV